MSNTRQIHLDIVYYTCHYMLLYPHAHLCVFMYTCLCMCVIMGLHLFFLHIKYEIMCTCIDVINDNNIIYTLFLYKNMHMARYTFFIKIFMYMSIHIFLIVFM